MKGLATLGLAAVAMLAPASAAGAAARFRACPDEAFAHCAKVSVPLDHERRGGPRIGIHLERWSGFGRPRGRRGALFVLAGGPGQSSSAVVNEDFLRLLQAGMRGRDLIAFDQRGTGRSGALRCGGLTRALSTPDRARQTTAAEACARGLGRRRSLYTTRQSVEDIEAARRALGVRRIAIYGVSYGSKLAQAYARRHPGRVERMVLDSVLDPGGPDPLQRGVFAAMPRVLRALCSGRCDAITPDPVADLADLAAQVAAAPLRGPLVGPRGRATERTLSAEDLFDIVLIGDLAPDVRAGLPAAVRNALRGDPVPLLRLGRNAGVPGLAAHGARAAPPRERFYSDALFAAVTCEESTFPWSRTAPLEDRLAQARAFVDGLGPGAFAPFGADVALATPYMAVCARWPSATQAPRLRGRRLTRAPVLLLNGEDDLRTPVEGARTVAGRFRRGTLLTVPAVGHAVVGGIPAVCVRRALRDFFGGRSVTATCRHRYEEALAPLAPLSLGEITPAPGTSGAAGQAVTAAWLTIADASEQANLESRGGGLRGGTYRYAERLVLDRASFVPGVEVSGKLDTTLNLRAQEFGRVEISGPGAPNGTLTIRRDGTVSGTLGGEAVSGRVPRAE
jgi:pimeloyl-ACP methyl ester carboxylesterase